VYGGKIVARGLLDRLGIGHDAIVAGAHATMHSAQRPFDEGERAVLEAWLDRVYADFTAKVGRCRRLSPDAVDTIARGRIWSGADAAERGLVDDLGGLDDAIRIARGGAGLPPTAPVRIFPHVTLAGRLRPPASSEDTGAAAAYRPGWGTLAAVAARAGLPAGGPLTMPGLVVTG
jgi:protease-4